MRNDDRPATKKLVISRTTIKNLTVRTGVKTGNYITQGCTGTYECEPPPETYGCGGGAPPASCVCRGYPYTGWY